MYKWGHDQEGVYERVIVNRAENTVVIDRMDSNWWHDNIFLGQRDLFYVEDVDKEAILEGTAKQSRLAFVRHNFWKHKFYAYNTDIRSHFSSWSYGK